MAVEVGAGLLALVALGTALSLWLDLDTETARTLLLGLVLPGATLFAMWVGARRSRPWLTALTVVSAAPLVVLVTIAARSLGAATGDPRSGIWWPEAAAVLGSVLWALVLAACLVERRLRAADDEPRPQRRPGWTVLAVLAPLAVLTALTVGVATTATGWLVRANTVLDAGPRAQVGPSAPQPPDPSGRARWRLDLPDGQGAVPTAAGLAVALDADGAVNAGVTLVDPASGQPRWRWSLRQLDDPPELATTDGGAGIVLRVEELPGEGGDADLVLDAATGRLRALWPDSIVATDPPVRFDRRARGTNGVLALADDGSPRWEYRPQRCADPDAVVASTPALVLVEADACDGGQELVALDAGTGDPTWTQPLTGDTSTSLVTGPWRLEVGDGRMDGRRLADGVVGWSEPLPSSCDRVRLFAAPDGAVVVCRQDAAGGEDQVVLVGPGTGGSRWRQDAGGAVASAITLDAGRVLVLAGPAPGERGPCRPVVLDGSTVSPLPEWDDALAGSAEVDCQAAEVHRAGADLMLELPLRDPGPGSGPVTRYVGLG